MINMILDDASDRMQKAIEAYQRDLATVRTGRATPAMLDRVMVTITDHQHQLIKWLVFLL